MRRVRRRWGILNVDPNLVRVGWVLLSLFTCTVGVVAYAACALILPTKSELY